MTTTHHDIPATGFESVALTGQPVVQLVGDQSVALDILPTVDGDPTSQENGLILQRGRVETLALPYTGTGYTLHMWSINGETGKVKVMQIG